VLRQLAEQAGYVLVHVEEEGDRHGRGKGHLVRVWVRVGVRVGVLVRVRLRVRLRRG
jgi:hypothetical protein